MFQCDNLDVRSLKKENGPVLAFPQPVIGVFVAAFDLLHIKNTHVAHCLNRLKAVMDLREYLSGNLTLLDIPQDFARVNNHLYYNVCQGDGEVNCS
jgi:hypothetical protein